MELVFRHTLLLKHFTWPLDEIQAQNVFFLIHQVVVHLIFQVLRHNAYNEDENLKF